MTSIIHIRQTDRIQGGSDVYFKSLSRLLKENGHRVVEFCASNLQQDMPREIDLVQPTPLDFLRYFYNLEARNKIRNFLEDIEIAHVHIYYAKLTTSILDELVHKGVPIVQTLHEYKLVCPIYQMFNRGVECRKCRNGAYYNALLNRCNRGSLLRSGLSMAEQYFSELKGARSKIDHFITVSDWQKRQLIEMGVEEDKLTTLHNFVFLDEFEPQPYVGEYFLYFGRIEKKKGVLTVLKALRSIKRDTGLSLPLRIVGRGSETEACAQYCRENNLCDVTFHDFCQREQLQEHIAGAIATVMPSLWGETFGIAVLESLASCRPVIVSATGGMMEIVDHEVEGLHFAPGSYPQLAEQMLRLYRDGDLARQMGQAGRNRVRRQFSAESHLRGLQAIYDRVLH